MSAPVPTTEPTVITAGNTIKWVSTLADYPASAGWTLVYYFVNALESFSATATALDDDHAVTISAATSANFEPGVYDWRAQVRLAAEVYTVRSGRVQVLPSFADGNVDARSRARVALDAIEATLLGRASSATAEYEISGRKLKYIPIADLLTLRDRLRRDVVTEEAAARIACGLAPRNQILARFNTR